MWYDADIDAMMTRTARRPVPTGRVQPGEALAFGLTLVGLFGRDARPAGQSGSPPALLAFTIFFYVVVYTMWLKRSTPQNIVIGGAAGAFPPMIGWAAVTGSLSLEPILLFLIIFFWTPPHFWALALYRTDDYARAGVPMLPVVAGDASTRRQILLYTLVLVPLGIAPWPLGYAGALYGVTAVVSGAIMLVLGWQVLRERRPAERASRQPVRLLDPLSVPAVRRAAGRARLGRADCPVGRVSTGVAMSEPARRRRHRADRGAEARAALALDRDCAGARGAGHAVLRDDAGEGPGRSDASDLSDTMARPAHQSDTKAAAARRHRRRLLRRCCRGMVGAAYAAVPLYNWFCRTTGFGGTTQVAETAPDHVLDRTITVRFDSNVAPGLPWKFEPEQNEIKVRIGEVATVHYKVTNQAARAIAAQASYNVSPPTGRRLLQQDQLLLLHRAALKPGETARWRSCSTSIRRSRRTATRTTSTRSRCPTRSTGSAIRRAPVADASAPSIRQNSSKLR